MLLENLGWNSFFEKNFEPFSFNYSAGRVTMENRGLYRLYTEYGELDGELSGKLRYKALNRQDLPAVGDWVVIDPREKEERATIHAILPRKSKFSRKTAGSKTEEQIVATNIDTLFLVSGLDRDINLRRIERYLIMSWESGARPVILLNKADLCEDTDRIVRDVEIIAPAVPVLLVSAARDEGLESLFPFLTNGETVSLLGSSGVGKSTIVNRLVGRDLQKVREVRSSDDRGKHTTTNRELIILPSGGLIIDTPGMRELQLWEADDGIGSTFADIEELALECHFRDCRHKDEPGCAVLLALEEGRIDDGRYENYGKMQRELTYLEKRQKHKASFIEKERGKRISRLMKKVKTKKGR